MTAKTLTAKTLTAKTLTAKTLTAKTLTAKTLTAKTLPAKTLPAKTLPARPKKSNANRIVVVATNSDYATLCMNSRKRLTSKANVELLPYQALEQKGAKSQGDWTLIVSRLSDITKEVVEVASAGVETKQLVFLETLPVEAMAARLMPLNIRNPQRIHIAAQRKPSEIEALIYRTMSGLVEGDGSQPIVDAWIEGEHLVLLSPAFARLNIPVAKLARFGISKAKVPAFEIDEDGRFLHWPHADVHLGWRQFQQLVDPASMLAAADKTNDYNRRYGAAIRAIREEHGLKQADVKGITVRQLRRVEQGQQTATKGTLEALAKAHSLSLEDYVGKLANAVQ